jgi:hypothetical protein
MVLDTALSISFCSSKEFPPVPSINYRQFGQVSFDTEFRSGGPESILLR